ncbi:helical backbone metal receptor [Nitrogeniibacter aestuarii]|uniref:helical backbone metal receptor n=1 Tax=Nitrogeniibacter aestuarii TaxID=2815343 RepID=UPI001D12C470|nr:helical backbone metal receptor [Nitrogeniibacter aestuarii]
MCAEHGIDAVGVSHPPAEGEVRIVSLVPSITELVCDLGLTGQLVGRTGFCIHPRERLRAVDKVGGTKDVKLDRIRALAPTHVILNMDENTREVADALAAFVPHLIVTHPLTPEDNRGLYRLLGHVFRREAQAEALVSRLDEALSVAEAAAADLPTERVLYLIWREPWMTVAPETYVSATLARVGWMTQPVAPLVRYPAFEIDEDWLAKVDRVLLSSEPYRFREKHLAEVSAWLDRPVHLIDGEWASWYGSRAIEGMAALADFRKSLVV